MSFQVHLDPSQCVRQLSLHVRPRQSLQGIETKRCVLYKHGAVDLNEDCHVSIDFSSLS